MISRPRVVNRFTDPATAYWFIEAGAGFGKTVLLAQIRQVLPQSLIVVRKPVAATDVQSFINELIASTRRAGHLDTAEAIVGADSDPATVGRALVHSERSVAIDDIDRWDDDVASFLVDLAEATTERIKIVIAGRSVPSRLEALRSSERSGVVTGEDMAFTLDETEDILAPGGIDDDVAAMLQEVSGGWPLAVASSAARMTTTSDPRAVAQALGLHESLVDGLLRSYLDELAGSDVEAAARLARLPFFDDVIAELVGSSGVIGRLTAAGIPITRRLDGWSEIAGQFRSALARRTEPVGVPNGVTGHLIERNEVQAAINVCLAAGDMTAAAEVIASLTTDHQTLLEANSLNAAITTIAESVEHAPRCLLTQAEVNGSFGRMAEGFEALERAIEIYEGVDPELRSIDHVETSLVLALWRVVSGEFEEAQNRLDASEAPRAVLNNSRLEARAHDVRGLLHQLDGSTEALEAASQEYARALAIWRSLGESRPAAVTSFRLATGLLGDLGRRTEALELLDSLPSVGPMTLVNRARLGLERALLLPYLGRAREVADVVAEPRRIAQLLGHDWLVGWTYWPEIVAASFLGDGDETERLVDEFQATGYIVMNDYSQSVMWCEVAEALGRCDRFDRAAKTLDLARNLEHHIAWYVEYVHCTLLARSGDASEALERLETLQLSEEVNPPRRWRIDLFIGYCYWRLGNLQESEAWLDRAVERADEIGQVSLPDIVEGRLLAAMQTAQPERVPGHGPIVEVSLFRDFEVRINGTPAELPKGRVSNLVKLIVLGGGRLTLDQAIDALWPESDLEQGRRRLRNVLNRLRQVCGPIIERDGEELLLSGVSSDYQRAHELTVSALRPAASAAAVQEALQARNYPLLPGDRYEEWAEEARRNHRTELVKLFDAQAVLAEAAGNLDLTVSALRQAHELDDLRTNRMEAAAALLRAAGRDAAARVVAG